MKFIKENFLVLIVLLLIAVLFLQRCNESESTNTIITRDSIIKIISRDTIYITSPTIVKSTFIRKDSVFLPSSVPSTDYSELKYQFEELKSLLLTQVIYKDTAKFDSSLVIITDTVELNKIKARGVEFKLKYPIITIIEHVPNLLKNQFYIGGQLEGEQAQLIKQINANLLFKNKKDQIFGGGVGINVNGKIVYNIQSYWKIKLKK